VLDHLEDLESDFRVYYRLTPEDILELDGPHFLSLARRVPAYGGVMAVRIEQEGEGSTPVERASGAEKTVPATPEGLAVGGVSDLFTFGAG